MPLERRLSKPNRRLGIVFINPFSPFIAPAHPVLRVAVPLHRGLSEPAKRLFEILRSIDGSIPKPELILSDRIPLLCGFLEPGQCGLRVPRNPITVLVEFAQPVLRGGIPLIGGFLIPESRFDTVGSGTLAKIVTAARPILRLGMPLFRSFPKKLERAQQIFVRAGIIVILCQPKLGFGITFFSFGLEGNHLFIGKGNRFGGNIGLSGKIVVRIVRFVAAALLGLLLGMKFLFDRKIVGRGIGRFLRRFAKGMKDNHTDKRQRQNNH